MNQTIITKAVLDEAGIDLNGQDVEALLAHLNDTLAERVGAEITESLDDAKLRQLIDLQDNVDDEAVATWIEHNVPELQAITQDEIDIIIGELVENSEAVNEA